MKKILWLALGLIVIIGAIFIYKYEPDEVVSYKEVVGKVYNDDVSISKIIIENRLKLTDTEITDKEIIEKIFSAPSDMKLVRTDELPLSEYKIKVYTNPTKEEPDFTLEADRENNLFVLAIYELPEPEIGPAVYIFEIKGTNELIELMDNLK